MAHEPDGGGRMQGDPAVMLASLQTTHQLADGKAGILAGVQAALVVSFGPWVRMARDGWGHRAFGGILLDALAALFAVAFLVGVACVALVLRPRLWRPSAFNRYSVHAMSRAATAPPGGAGGDPAVQAGAELWDVCRFLAAVTVTKCRWATAGLACTALMAATAGLCVLLRAVPG
jgi:hypothetical protein